MGFDMNKKDYDMLLNDLMIWNEIYSKAYKYFYLDSGMGLEFVSYSRLKNGDLRGISIKRNLNISSSILLKKINQNKV